MIRNTFIFLLLCQQSFGQLDSIQKMPVRGVNSIISMHCVMSRIDSEIQIDNCLDKTLNREFLIYLNEQLVSNGTETKLSNLIIYQLLNSSNGDLIRDCRAQRPISFQIFDYKQKEPFVNIYEIDYGVPAKFEN